MNYFFKHLGGNGKHIIRSLLSSLFLSLFLLAGRAEFLTAKIPFARHMASWEFALEFLLIAAVCFFLFELIRKASGSFKMPASGSINFLMLTVPAIACAFLVFIYHLSPVLRDLYGITAAFFIFFCCVPRVLPAGNGVQPEKSADKTAVFFAAAVFTALFINTAFFHYTFTTLTVDMGIFMNSIWQAGDNGSQYTWTEGFIDHRGVHFQPVIYAMAPVLKACCSGYVLLFIQALALAVGLVFFYFLASEVLKNKAAALLLMLAAAVCPYFVKSSLFDFHFANIYFFSFFSFLYFGEKGNFRASTLSLILCAALREELAVYMVFSSLFLYFRKKDPKYIWLAAASLVYSLIIIGFVMPAFNPQNRGFVQVLLRNAVDLQRYLYPGMAGQLVVVAAGFLLLPFLPSPAMALLAMPALIVHVVAGNTDIKPLFTAHYASIVLPGLLAAFIYNLEGPYLKKPFRDKYLTHIAALLLIVQAQLHLVAMPVKNFWLMILFYGCLIFLMPVLIAGRKIRTSTGLLIAASAVLFVYAAGYVSHYAFRGGMVPAGKRESIYKAIQLLPKDPEIPVFSNPNIVPHISCRKYVNQIASTGGMDFMKPVLDKKFSMFYLLVDIDSFSYYQHAPRRRNEEINSFAAKADFSSRIIYGENNVYLVYFERGHQGK